MKNNESKTTKYKKVLTINLIGIVLILVVTFLALLKPLIIPSINYSKAVDFYNNEKYEEALERFLKIEEFKDVKDYIIKVEDLIIYEKAVSYLEEDIYGKALMSFFKVKHVKDSQKQIDDIIELFESGSWFEFGRYPAEIVDDENVITILDNLEERNSSGYYEYDGNEYDKLSAKKDHENNFLSNGEQIIEDKIYYFIVKPIRWKMINQEDGVYTLITEMIIDQSKFHSSIGTRVVDDKAIYSNNYEHSAIREWLNEEFINKAFNVDELEFLLKTLIKNDGPTTELNNNRYASNNTTDKVYILSYEEAYEKYFQTDEERKSTLTDYAIAKNVRVSGEDAFWWLRSPSSFYSYFANYINVYGMYQNYYTDSDFIGVRPVIKIKINS